MSNNQNAPRQTGNGLFDVNIPIEPVGALYRESTNRIANYIVDMLVNTFGIKEADHVFMYPIPNKQGAIVDFDLLIYFDTRRSLNDWQIRRVSNGKSRNVGNGKVDFSGLIGAKLSSGNFELGETFKRIIGPIAVLDDERRIVCDVADRNHPEVAVVKCNFFKVIALCLGIKPDDNFDFTVIDCSPVRNNSDNIDYVLTISKEISTEPRRRGKNGINYDYIDRRQIGGNRR